MKKRSIIVNVESSNTGGAAPSILQEITAGIEEEGVPYEVRRKNGSYAIAMAEDASLESVIGVGIGIDELSAAMVIGPLRSAVFEAGRGDKKRARMLGHNAGRAVKKEKWVTSSTEEEPG